MSLLLLLSTLEKTMERNKARAEKAMELAEEKFRIGDMKSAWDLAMKAQSSFSSLPGLRQLIVAYQIQITAATKKLPTGATDWHAVLGVHPTDDLNAIKKQFKSLCLATHPDKNHSVAADGAFKLVMEAWEALSHPDPAAPVGVATPPPPTHRQSSPSASSDDDFWDDDFCHSYGDSYWDPSGDWSNVVEV